MGIFKNWKNRSMHHALIFDVNNWQLVRNFGAHKIASWLRRHDWDVEVVDYGGHWPKEWLKEFCAKRINSNTIFIGFSDTWGLTGPAVEKFNDLISDIQKKYPHIKTILGGQNVTSSKIRCDYYVDGFAEYAILELVKNILGTNTQKLLYTLWNNKKLVKGVDYPAIFMPDLFMKYETRDFIEPYEQLGVELSRGCKFSCDFCGFFPLNVKGDNFRPVSDYIDNLNYLRDQYGVEVFFASDSTLNVDYNKLSLFAEATSAMSWKPWIGGYTRIDLLVHNKKNWDTMIAMGHVGHHYGIETLNWESGKSIGKGMHPDKIKQGLIDARDYFSSRSLYTSSTSWILGLPYETLETMEAGIQWYRDNFPNQHSLFFPLGIPHPNTAIQHQKSLFSESYDKYGYINADPDNLEEFMWYNTNTNLSKKQMQEYAATSPLIADYPQTRGCWNIGENRKILQCDIPTAISSQFKFLEIYNLFEQGSRKVVIDYAKKKLNHS
jgi:radical SAM superfamily enzyme YgiQ (UPF0313 family)